MKNKTKRKRDSIIDVCWPRLLETWLVLKTVSNVPWKPIGLVLRTRLRATRPSSLIIYSVGSSW